MNRNQFWWKPMDPTRVVMEGWIPSPGAGGVGGPFWHVCPEGLAAHIWGSPAIQGQFETPDFGMVAWTCQRPSEA
jgi:hypothetical protein